MSNSIFNRLRKIMLPGLKPWVLMILCGISLTSYGVFLVLGSLPYGICGLIVIISGLLFVCFAVAKVTLSVLGAYLPSDCESIPDVLYRGTDRK